MRFYFYSPTGKTKPRQWGNPEVAGSFSDLVLIWEVLKEAKAELTSLNGLFRKDANE